MNQNLYKKIVILFIITATSFASDATTLNFSFKSEQYRQNKYPTWVTVLGNFRQQDKIRPLFVYGRNLSGNLAIKFDNMNGLLNEYNISSTTDAKIVFNVPSATKSADIERFAAMEFLDKEPFPDLILEINKITNWKPKDDLMKSLLSLNRSSGRNASRTLKPTYDITIEGSFKAITGVAAFKAPATIRFSEIDAYWAAFIMGKIELDPKDIGIKGDSKVLFSFRTEVYSEPPTEHKAPDIKNSMPEMNLNLID